MDIDLTNDGSSPPSGFPEATDPPSQRRSSLEERPIARRIYNFYSPFYDLFFGWIEEPRLRKGIQELQIQPGHRVLDIGVGTGISLPIYPKDCQVVGIDASPGMLEKAMRKKTRLKLDHVELQEMDAQNLRFADNSFDRIFSSFVISVVPDPVRMVQEIHRVAKPGARIVIVNHFRSRNRFLGGIEDVVTPMTQRLGWRSDISLQELVGTTGLQVVSEFQVSKRDLWRVVVAVKPA
jgi:phosphatidylethanolamine/phosphatidyl-N-methylethanolamine N-methyltransferase